MKTITYSAIRSFLNCRKEFYYRYIRQIKPAEVPVYFDIGRATHAALEVWYKTRQTEKAEDAIRLYFNSRYPSPDDENYHEQVQKLQENFEKSERIFQRYLRYYEIEDRKFKTLEVEVERIIKPKEIGINLDIDIALKADAIFTENGLSWLVEHKTAADIDISYKKKLTVDLQSMFYLICLNALGYNLQGVIYNVISKSLPAKPEILKNGKLSKAKNRKPDLYEYIKAIEDNGLDQGDYTDCIEWLKENQKEYFYREQIVFHESQLKELKKELAAILFEIKNQMNDNSFYKNTSNCIGFGTCQYFDVCTSIHPESVIENSFVEKAKTHEEITGA